jgi:peptidoglycan/LPS O-acetylase OafA/YrhL
METNATNRIFGIDALRGYAALYVMVFHTYFLGGIYIHEGKIRDVIIHGDMGVPIFFVISGFSITYSIFHKEFFNLLELKNFYIRRFYRIIPLFYFAFILKLVFMVVNAESIKLYDSILTLSFFFPFVSGHQESMVMAGWSLGIEMVFYLLFPLLFLILRINNRIFSSFIFLAIFIHFFASFDKNNSHLNFAFQAIFFLLGMLMCFYISVIQKLFSHGMLQIISLVAILFGVIILILGMWIFKNQPFVFFKFSGIVLLVSGTLFYRGKLLVNKINIFLGDLSYSIYLTHPLVILFLVKIGLNVLIYEYFPNFGFLIFISIVGISVIGVSFLTYNFIEKPFINIGKGKVLNFKITKLQKES